MKKYLKTCGTFLLIACLSGCSNEANNLVDETPSAVEVAEPEVVYEPIEWPTSKIASLLPTPVSMTGLVKWAEDYGFVIYISEVSHDDFSDYAELCKSNGFTESSRQGDDFYYADDRSKNHISLNWTEDNVMFIRIDASDSFLENDDLVLGDEDEISEDALPESDAEQEYDENVEEEITPTTDEVEQDNVDNEILTIQNCPDLEALLTMKGDLNDASTAFAEKYKGRTIEFEGCIAYLTNHADYNTRYDILLYGGDYDENSLLGPSFQFKDVGVSNLGLSGLYLPDFVKTGSNISITAIIRDFDNSTWLFELKPVLISER